jgi:hypothetical protein
VKPAGSGVRTFATAAVAVCLSAVTVVAVTLGATYNWPDNYHTDYGFPWVWGTHLTDSFAGPVDKWSVSLTNLGLDLVFWLAALSLVVVAFRVIL